MATKHFSSLADANNQYKLYKLYLVIMILCISTTLRSQNNFKEIANKKVVQKYLDTFNSHDLSDIRQLFDKNYIWHTLDGRKIFSSQDSSHIVTLRSVLQVIPNIHYTIESIISEGDLVAVNSTVTGSNINASGLNQINFKQMFFFRLNNGGIKEEWEVLDTDLMLKQMGRICK